MSFMMPVTLVYQDDYLSVFHERDGKLIRSVRSSRGYPDVAAMEQSYDRMISLVRSFVHRDSVLLSDVRQAPGRNDPAFERAMEEARQRFYPLFRKRGVLVQSTIGKLHINRLIHTDKLERMVSQDEAELLRYLELDPPAR